MYSTETSHPGSFDSFVCPPTCAARNFHLRKIYEASANRVSPVISPEGFFLKIITSTRSSGGRSLLALAFPVCLNNRHTQSPRLEPGQPAIPPGTVAPSPAICQTCVSRDNPHLQEPHQVSKALTLAACAVIHLHTQKSLQICKICKNFARRTNKSIVETLTTQRKTLYFYVPVTNVIWVCRVVTLSNSCHF